MEYPRLVHWQYYDGHNIFGNKNDKEQLAEIFINDPKVEEVLKGGHVSVLGVFPVYRDPYFSKKTTEGYTQRAKAHGKLKRRVSVEHPELERALKEMKDVVYPYGDYVYINMPHLDNYVNPMVKDEEFWSKNFVYRDRFDENFIHKIIQFKPEAMFGGVITSHLKEDVPKLLDSLRKNFPDIYYSMVEGNEFVHNFNEEYSYIGKKAKINSLSAGKVKLRVSFLDDDIFYWDGVELFREIKLYDGEDKVKQIIEPSKDTIVEIIDENTVNDDVDIV